ncbi:MAG: serine hydrolase [Alphaproteobacteria bacterium]|nr:serine hydrolase [Alphaproteobacteria bacterium]
MRRRDMLIAAAGFAAAPAVAQTRRPFPEAIAYHARQGGSALIIIRHGVVWAEDYGRGDTETSAAPLGAISKVFATLLAAALSADGLLNLDEPVALTFGAWGAHPMKSRITVRMLLNQTSGMTAGRTIPSAQALELEPTALPGAEFIDDPIGVILFEAIARRKLENAGRTPPANYLRARVLTPIAAQGVLIPTTPTGDCPLADGLFAPAQALARVGEIIRREGLRQADSFLDDRVLRQAAQGTPAQPRYGLGLWLASGRDSGAQALRDVDFWATPLPMDAMMAAGPGGQRLYIVPSRGLVIARVARDSGAFSDAAFLDAALRDAPLYRRFLGS